MSLCSGGAGLGGGATCRRLPFPSAGGGRNAVRIFSSRSASSCCPLQAVRISSSEANDADPANGGGADRRKVREVLHQIGRAEEICEVDVVSWRERRIKARVLVAADVDSVWSVLTDYERLANFIPNLIFRSLSRLLSV